jgi:hypothetical protein
MYNDGELDISVVNYLNEQQNMRIKFYVLLKVHKELNPPPGRPIVSTKHCPTERMS